MFGQIKSVVIEDGRDEGGTSVENSHCHIVNFRGSSYRMRHHTELSKVLPLASSDVESQNKGENDDLRLVTSAECAIFDGQISALIDDR